MRHSRGFTIIELLIAITVLSVILLMSSVIISSLGRLYFKGLNQSRIQQNARSIVDQISEDVQSSGTTVTTGNVSGMTYYCVGNARYTMIFNKQLKSGQHVLWRDVPGAAACSAPSGGFLNGTPASGVELIGDNSSLLQLSVVQNGKAVSIDLSEGYGDAADATLYNTADSPRICKGGSGSQFCATASISTLVVQRNSN